jgi:hypothetical protein
MLSRCLFATAGQLVSSDPTLTESVLLSGEILRKLILEVSQAAKPISESFPAHPDIFRRTGGRRNSFNEAHLHSLLRFGRRIAEHVDCASITLIHFNARAKLGKDRFCVQKTVHYTARLPLTALGDIPLRICAPSHGILSSGPTG